MFDVKSIFASKTIWGAVIMVLPTLAGLFGITGAETTQATTLATNLVNDAVLAFGFVMTVWGRMHATKTVTVTGK